MCYFKEIIECNVGCKEGLGLLNVCVDYWCVFGFIDVIVFFDVINVMVVLLVDDIEFDYCWGIEVVDDSEVELLIGLWLDYVW